MNDMESIFEYHIDIVFCIETADSGFSFAEMFGQDGPSFLKQLERTMALIGKVVAGLRVRLIAFGDLETSPNNIASTDFLTVVPPTDISEFSSAWDFLHAPTGHTTAASALYALSIALASDWSVHGDRRRQQILFAPDRSVGKSEPPDGRSEIDFDSAPTGSLHLLTDWWHSLPATRRLVLIAPDKAPWSTIGDDWEQTVFFPSKAGDGLKDVDSRLIIQCFCNSV